MAENSFYYHVGISKVELFCILFEVGSSTFWYFF